MHNIVLLSWETCSQCDAMPLPQERPLDSISGVGLWLCSQADSQVALRRRVSHSTK